VSIREAIGAPGVGRHSIMLCECGGWHDGIRGCAEDRPALELQRRSVAGL
jgi:hypothetical protein